MQIVQATVADLATIAELALLLWPEHSQAELVDEFGELLATGNTAIFLAMQGTDNIAFAQCAIRNDYVEGSQRSPVGYLEGIFVRDASRRQGIARRLIAACAAWASSRGCTQLASDCELTNAESLSFHLRAGFSEANRIICFITANPEELRSPVEVAIAQQCQFVQ